MRSISRSGAMALLGVLSATLAGAQVNESAQTTPCAATAAVRPYGQCALSFDIGAVRQAPDWHVVSRDERFHRMPLSRLVDGDSAQRYARQYERDARLADRFYVLGAAFIAGTATIAFSYQCGTRTQVGGCSNSAAPYMVSASVLATGALVAAIVQIPLRRSAWHSAATAISWHNAGLTLR